MTMHTRKADPAIIKAYAEEGYSQATIATLVGVTHERIRQICNRDNIKTIPGFANQDLSDRMRECAARGMTIQQASVALKRGSLHAKAKAEGIEFAPQVFRWHEIRDAAAEGLTLTECARRMGWNTNCVWNEATRHGITFTKVSASRQSAVKGVSWSDRNSRWFASIRRDGKQVHLGSFVNEADAIAARRAAEASK